MAKSAELHYSYKTASMQHQRAMFWAFSDQLSIGLSVESIDSSDRHFLSRQQPRFLQETLQLHQSLYFQQQALSRIESISGCTFNFASGRFEVSSSKKMPSSEWKRIRWGVPLFGLILKLNTDVSETFSNLAVHFTYFSTWTNLPNVARYGREMSNVHQRHPRAVKRLWMVSWFCNFRFH